MQMVVSPLGKPTSGIDSRAFDARELRDVAGQFASGVTVITVAAQGGTHCMTANSFISVSLDPPLVLVSVANRARMLGLIASAGSFGISVLSEEQRALSQQFSGRGTGSMQVPLATLGDVPVVPDALGSFACRLHSQLPGGDHTLILGEVLELRRRAGDPLLFFGGYYRAVRKVDEELVYASLF